MDSSRPIDLSATRNGIRTVPSVIGRKKIRKSMSILAIAGEPVKIWPIGGHAQIQSIEYAYLPTRTELLLHFGAINNKYGEIGADLGRREKITLIHRDVDKLIVSLDESNTIY